jgi:hypothetical protein
MNGIYYIFHFVGFELTFSLWRYFKKILFELLESKSSCNSSFFWHFPLSVLKKMERACTLHFGITSSGLKISFSAYFFPVYTA